MGRLRTSRAVLSHPSSHTRSACLGDARDKSSYLWKARAAVGSCPEAFADVVGRARPAFDCGKNLGPPYTKTRADGGPAIFAAACRASREQGPASGRRNFRHCELFLEPIPLRQRCRLSREEETRNEAAVTQERRPIPTLRLVIELGDVRRFIRAAIEKRTREIRPTAW